jgi:hypothetical protein
LPFAVFLFHAIPKHFYKVFRTAMSPRLRMDSA